MTYTTKNIALLVVMLCSQFTFAQFGNLLKDVQKNVEKKTTPAAKTNSKPAGNNPTNSNNKTNSSPKTTTNTIAEGRDWYVSQTNGTGKEGTKEQPAKDLGNIVAQLKAGDVVHIATGTYLGRAENGSDEITVPVSIIGGYSNDFNTRDPWGQYKTILTGNNVYMTSSLARLAILTDKSFADYSGEVLVDGIVFDNAPRNRYKTTEQLCILRKAKPETGENPSPETSAISIKVGKNTQVAIRNCVVTNDAASQGAIDVQLGENGNGIIENNLIINNTGEGIFAKSNWHPADHKKGVPAFTVSNNTILFSWKHDEVASYGGNGLKLDTDLMMLAQNNVFGFGDFGAVDNIKKCPQLVLKNNLLFGNMQYDYREYNTKMKIDEIGDESDILTADSKGNFSAEVKVPVSKKWSENYLNRPTITREALDASVKVSNSGANQVRSILSLPVQGNTSVPNVAIWLHKITLDDALKCGMQQYQGVGCVNPKNELN